MTTPTTDPSLRIMQERTQRRAARPAPALPTYMTHTRPYASTQCWATAPGSTMTPCNIITSHPSGLCAACRTRKGLGMAQS